MAVRVNAPFWPVRVNAPPDAKPKSGWNGGENSDFWEFRPLNIFGGGKFLDGLVDFKTFYWLQKTKFKNSSYFLSYKHEFKTGCCLHISERLMDDKACI